jgi:hypothetical protein
VVAPVRAHVSIGRNSDAEGHGVSCAEFCRKFCKCVRKMRRAPMHLRPRPVVNHASRARPKRAPGHATPPADKPKSSRLQPAFLRQLRQRLHELAEVYSHGGICATGVTGRDRVGDRFMLGDQDVDRRCFWKGQEAHPIPLRLQRLQKLPRALTPGARGEFLVEFLVMPEKPRVVPSIVRQEGKPASMTH